MDSLTIAGTVHGVKVTVEQRRSSAPNRASGNAPLEHRPDDERLHGSAIVGRAWGS